MKKQLKKYYKDSMGIAATGLGLSAMAGVEPSAPIGKFSKGLSPIASMSVMGTTLSMAKKLSKKVK